MSEDGLMLVACVFSQLVLGLSQVQAASVHWIAAPLSTRPECAPIRYARLLPAVPLNLLCKHPVGSVSCCCT